MTNSDKIYPIKSCPFCDNDNVKVIFHDSNNYAVTCDYCNARGPSVSYYPPDGDERNEILSIDRWNAKGKVQQEKISSEFFAENKRRRIEHIYCFCEKCMNKKHNDFMNRISERLLQSLENVTND